MIEIRRTEPGIDHLAFQALQHPSLTGATISYKLLSQATRKGSQVRLYSDKNSHSFSYTKPQNAGILVPIFNLARCLLSCDHYALASLQAFFSFLCFPRSQSTIALSSTSTATAEPT